MYTRLPQLDRSSRLLRRSGELSKGHPLGESGRVTEFFLLARATAECPGGKRLVRNAGPLENSGLSVS